MIRNNILCRLFCMFFALSIIFPSALTANAAEVPNMTAVSSYLVDVTSDFVLHSNNSDAKRAPASTTKIMTALIVLENTEPTDILTFTSEAFDGVGIYRSAYNFKDGEQFTIEQALYIIMLNSSNDMSNALAIHVAGSTEAFVQMMNDKAAELGCAGTNFANPHGLDDPEHYTTAEDLFKIATEAMTHELFATIANTAQKTIPPTNMTEDERLVLTTNRLILRKSDEIYYDPIKGIKTGYTDDAGNCLVSIAEKGDTVLMSVVLGCETDVERGFSASFNETRELMEWGFNNFETRTMLEAEEPVSEIPVALSSERESVVLVTSGSIEGIMPIDAVEEDIITNITLDQNVKAPVEIGQKLGSMTVSYAGHVYGTVDLISLQEAPLSQVLYYVDILDNFFDSLAFKIILGLIIGFIIFYVVGYVLLRRANKRRALRNKHKRRMARYTGGRNRKYK